MPALRRSCDACAAAKRRCNLATPRCARCTSKNATCTYANQPGDRLWIQFHGTTRKHRMGGDSPPPVKLALGCGPVLGLWSYTPKVYVPEVVRWFSPVAVQRQIGILRTFVAQFAQHGATAFLHPCLYGSRLPGPLRDMSRVCTNHCKKNTKPENICSRVEEMLRSAANARSFSELVAHVQAIALLQIIRLCEGQARSEHKQDEVEDKIFWELAMVLWIRAPEQLPIVLSPWRAWLFAESVRRTILVCHIALAIRGALRRGYAVQLLCVEALPFDMRTRLWDAECADAWEEEAAASREPSLVSLRQFSEQQQPERHYSPFEKLLLLFFNGGCPASLGTNHDELEKHYPAAEDQPRKMPLPAL